MRKQYIMIISVLILGLQTGFAQEKFKLDERNSEITVTGTSSVHDWEMNATAMNASIQLSIKENSINDIVNVDFSMPTEKLKSENSIMDKKSWSALKSDKHESIRFDLSRVSGFTTDGKTFSGTATGNLFIAGKSRPVTIPFDGNIKTGNTITVTGQEKINMKDFNISPPTAMLGTLKTGEEVTVKFKMDFVAESQYTGLLQ
ncbi:MAG: YceI family protein [Bacteroidales bacterium]|nr:YceI family protein [Bacteroidales bacterium]MDT8431272.1 YceI family protein [Bacteroidales bacterium]